MRTNRLALRVLQNRTGLVPRPSWCTFRVRPAKEGAPMMSVDGVRRAFEALGELDLVRLIGPEPFLRPDLIEVTEAILEASRPSVIHVTSEGLAPEAAEDFVRGISTARRLRFLVRCPSLPKRESDLSVHRRFARALETIERLRAAGQERGFGVAALHEVSERSTSSEIERLRTALASVGVELYLVFAAAGPGAPIPGPVEHVDLVEDELEGIEGQGGRRLARVGQRYYLEGVQARLRGDAVPRPRPRCTALRSHVRVEPDGSVPTCGFASEPVGRLHEDGFESVWFGAKAEAGRAFVDACVGCWSADEVLPNALYSGDIVRGWRDRGSGTALVARRLRRRQA